MMMLDEDWLELFWNAANGTLEQRKLRWKEGAACCVTMAGKQYPQQSSKGVLIEQLPAENVASKIFYAGVRQQDSKLYTNGGRVLSVCHHNVSLQEAIRGCYELVSQVNCNDLAYRSDIGG